MKKQPQIVPAFQQLIELTSNTYIDTLGIQFTEANQHKIVAGIDLEKKHLQPLGYLHGGVSLGLAETIISMGALLHIDRTTQIVFGQEINANHLRSVQTGYLEATATPFQIGRYSQVWEARIRLNNQSELVAIARCTLAVRKKR